MFIVSRIEMLVKVRLLVLSCFCCLVGASEITAECAPEKPVREISLELQKQVEKLERSGRYSNAVPPATALLNKDVEPDLKAEGFVDLYNGKDLSGWVVRGGTCTFEAKEDVIVGTCVKGSPSTYLSTEKEDYADFIFTLEVSWEVDSNSGVMFRAQRKQGQKFDIVYGWQCEAEGFGRSRGWSGGIYGQSAGDWIYPLWLDEHKEARMALKKNAEEWNRLTIQVIGNRVKTWVNGIPAAHIVDDEYQQGFFGLQIHSGKQGVVHFRNIKVKEL